ncbi:MAG: PQ-loop repeat-containing protein [Nocardioidaceae bacterium]|nr:PQ-loop repeat-containing protein [Nocardioidaceae bacterium]
MKVLPPVLVVLGAVASFFSLSSTVPQVLRAFRSRSAQGVSWGSVLISLGTFVLWCVYSAVVADPVQLVNNTLAFGLLALLAVGLLRADRRRWWTDGSAALLAAAAGAVVGIALAAALGPFVLAMVGTVVSAVRMWPQTRLAISRAPMWGLDPWATTLGWLGWLVWTAYGVGVGDHALTVSSITGFVMQSTIMAFRLPPRRTLHAVAGGRLGPVAARIATPVSGRFPMRAADFELAA